MCFQSVCFDITRQEKIEIETVLDIIIVGCPRYLLEIETPEWKLFNQKTDAPNVKRGIDRPNRPFSGYCIAVGATASGQKKQSNC